MWDEVVGVVVEEDMGSLTFCGRANLRDELRRLSRLPPRV
jgi:hypothetical protein